LRLTRLVSTRLRIRPGKELVHVLVAELLSSGHCHDEEYGQDGSLPGS
jgi:hypothetical protein